MNVMTTESKAFILPNKEVLNVTNTELTSELREAYALRRQIIKKATKKGKINLIWRKVGGNDQFSVVDYAGWTNPFLVEVIFASETPLGGLGKRPNPWEIIIFEPKERGKQAAIVQIAKHLPAYFDSFYLKTKQVPIDIYDRGKSFIEKKPPIAEVRFRSRFNLTTVSTPKLKAA